MPDTATVTILFTDVVGSVELRTRRGDESAHQIMRSHFELVRPYIERYSGQEVKTMGDSFMVAFGSPRSAVDCAVAVQRALAEHNLNTPDDQIHVRMGMNTGEAIREEGDLFGSAVDAASRVMSKAAGGQIFVPEAVRSAIGKTEDVSIIDRGLFWLKGFPERWRLHEVLWGGQQAATAPVRPAIVEQTPFVGREKERAELRQSLDRAGGGHGALVTIAGEPGVGKTRITEELTAEAYRHGLLTLTGHCYETEGAPPYIPFVEIIESAARMIKLENLLKILGDAAPEAAKLVPQLRQLFPEIPQPQQLPPEQERRFLLSSLRDFFERLALDRAVFMVVEDLHWADDSTLLLIEHLTQRLHEIPALVVATYRHTELDVAPSLAKTLEELNRRRLLSEIMLRQLPHSDVKAMLHARLGQAPPKHLADLIYHEAEGIPFFVEEIFKYLSEEGKLFNDEGQLRADIEIREHEVPKGIRSIIGRRLGRVSDECRQVLSAAAIIGRAFDFELLEKLVDLHENAVFNAIDSAERTQLIVSEPKNGTIKFKFYHELIRQTLISDLTSLGRQRMHRHVGEAMENLYADSIEEHISAVAHHFFQAGNTADPGKTLHYLMLAGDQALSASAFEDALRLFNNALTKIPKDDKKSTSSLMYKQGLALRSLDRRDEAMSLWEKALELSEELGDAETTGFICEALSFALLMQARLGEAREIADRGLAALGERVTGIRSILLSNVGGIVSMTPGTSYEQANNLFSQAIEVADQLGEENVLGPILFGKGHFHNFYWQARESFEAFQRGGGLLASSNNFYLAADAFGFAQWEMVVLGLLEQSRAMGAEAHELAARSGNANARWVVGNNDAFAALLGTADIDGFKNRFVANLERDLEAGLMWVICLDQGFIGRAQFWQGRWDEARESFRQGTEFEFPGVFFGFSTGSLFLSTAYSGDREAALAILEQAKDAFPKTQQPNTGGAWVLLESAIEGLAVLGEWEKVARLYPLALESCISENRVRFDTEGVVQTGAGIAAMAGRQWKKAEEHFKTALRFAHEIPHKIAQPEVRRWYARMLIERNKTGDKEKASTLLNEAVEMYREIGMPKHLEMAEELKGRL